MRFAILGISHETNTFSRVPADYGQFEKSRMLRGADIVRHFGQASYTVSGYLEACGELGVEAVPLMYATTGPIGTITRDAYDRISSEMLGMLKKQGPWDAVLIANHGAAVAEHHPDMDGEFCRAVREIVGPKMPVGVTLDMHANVSAQVVRNTTVCVVWRTNPHLDPKLRGKKTAQLIHRTVKGEIRPVQHIETPPLVVNIVRQFTGELPMKALVADAVEANPRLKILDTSVAEGYPYADVAQMGMAFIAIADGDQKAAQDAARWMAERAWSRREELNTPVPDIREALKMAEERYAGPRPRGEEDPAPTDGSPLMALDTHPRIPSTGSGQRPSPEGSGRSASPSPLMAPSSTSPQGGLSSPSQGEPRFSSPFQGEDSGGGRPGGKAPRHGPIVLMDVGDNIGGGSSADSTHILHEARAMGLKSLLQSLFDPEAVQACVKAGVGAAVTLDVGGKTDEMHGKPINVTGTVPSSPTASSRRRCRTTAGAGTSTRAPSRGGTPPTAGRSC